jgi:3,5-epimerase/4-reductase
MQNREAVIAEVERVKPTHILNAAGSTGRPNVDWCEDHKEETVRNNVIGTLNLADVAFMKGIHITVFATGCIYTYDDKHPIGGPGYLETDKANFDGSFYSETKAHVEEVSLNESDKFLPANNVPGYEVLFKLPHPPITNASQRRPPLP